MADDRNMCALEPRSRTRKDVWEDVPTDGPPRTGTKVIQAFSIGEALVAARENREDAFPVVILEGQTRRLAEVPGLAFGDAKVLLT
jgi:hypothetical protein